ncbi:MAG TPA: VIT domain-containing protein, partial [Thermoanaerobaculia bacterium]|nr:VIT domain-containing protein [Thermoanaerobaculia bacterium]
MRRYACLVILAVLSLAATAQEPVTTLDQTHHPALLLKTNQPGVFLSAPAVSTGVSLQVRGIVARGVVRQRFVNATGRCVEALYVFPLSENATVDAMRMNVGVRTIAGEIEERAEAARVYEQAKSEGKKASLLEQHRPNLFTVSVASVGDGETVEIELEYQEIVRYDNRFSLRIPLAIGPRYTPPDGTSALPAMRQERTDPRRNPVAIEIDLDAGIALANVASTTHPIDATPLSGTRVTVKPRNVQIASDRDFELTWTPRLGSLPQSAAFSETAGGHRYTLLMLFPPDVANQQAAILARETIFILDTSGSMAGPSLEQAKQALLAAVDRLRPSDHFNV